MNYDNDKKEQKEPDSDLNIANKKARGVNETDTAPDEFIGPNADTDQPVDGQIINDAVLRGEPKADDRQPEESPKKEAPNT